jgi:predicted  nucleic acid-binding Zn ribbon protein
MKISKEVLIVIGMIEVKMLIVTMKKQRLMDKISNRKIMSSIIKLRKCKILKIMIRILISKKLIMIKNMEVLIKLVILIKL